MCAGEGHYSTVHDVVVLCSLSAVCVFSLVEAAAGHLKKPVVAICFLTFHVLIRLDIIKS